jgi:hypothetical protein
VALGVDVGNPTDKVALYETAGMRTTQAFAA